MQITIQARKFVLTDALRNYAERRLRFALTCCGDHIQRVVMRLSDINGPRGGEDKRCHLQVILSGLPNVVVVGTEADLYTAIDSVAERTGRSVVRKIERQQTLLRQASALVPKVEVTDIEYSV